MKASRVASILLLLTSLSVSNGVAAQQDDIELTARTHFAAGEYQQALDIYAKLYAQTLHPTYLRNVGRCYQNMGKPDEAISAFREYLREAENLEPKHRDEVEGFIHEMEDLKRQRVGASTSAAAATPPAAPAVSVAPAATQLPALPTATDRGADSSRIDASLKSGPAPTEGRGSMPIYTRWWFWTALGAVAVGGVATALALSSGGTAASEAMPTFGTKTAIPK
jgi:tetratricopeptide (TPR) repeat protein